MRNDNYGTVTTSMTHLVGKWSGTGKNGYLFQDGGNKLTVSPKDIKSGSARKLTLGSSYNVAFQYFDGRIDELRISNIERSDNWIKASYNTMYYGFDGGFFCLGPEETTP